MAALWRRAQKRAKGGPCEGQPLAPPSPLQGIARALEAAR